MMLSFLSDVMVLKETVRICSSFKSTVVKILKDETKATALKQPFSALFKMACKTILKFSLIKASFQNL